MLKGERIMGAPMPLRGTLLHDAIQDRIKRYIISRELKPGDTLPTESQLASELGVSRTSLREAMRSLQALGVVKTRHGYGTFVGQSAVGWLTDGLVFRILLDGSGARQSLRQLVEVREALEKEFIGRVAHVSTPAQRQELHGLLKEMAVHADREERFRLVDIAFHEALYRPLGNAMLVHFIHMCWDVFQEVSAELSASPQLLTTVADHQRIVDAIDAGDANAAATAMVAHFRGIKSRLDLPLESEGSTRFHDGHLSATGGATKPAPVAGTVEGSREPTLVQQRDGL